MSIEIGQGLEKIILNLKEAAKGVIMTEQYGLSRKAQLLEFIKEKPRQYKEIVTEFGSGGDIAVYILQLMHDELIYKPARGIYEVRPTALKSPKTK